MFDNSDTNEHFLQVCAREKLLPYDVALTFMPIARKLSMRIHRKAIVFHACTLGGHFYSFLKLSNMFEIGSNWHAYRKRLKRHRTLEELACTNSHESLHQCYSNAQMRVFSSHLVMWSSPFMQCQVRKTMNFYRHFGVKVHFLVGLVIVYQNMVWKLS